MDGPPAHVEKCTFYPSGVVPVSNGPDHRGDASGPDVEIADRRGGRRLHPVARIPLRRRRGLDLVLEDVFIQRPCELIECLIAPWYVLLQIRGEVLPDVGYA